jgi:hypothetical protein
MRSFDDIEASIERLLEGAANQDPALAMAELVADAEAVLEHWIVAKGGVPTLAQKEGFRLIALHRQGAKGEPSFNACRESCRELAYHSNLIATEPEHLDTPHRLRMAALVTRHILYFVSGKMEVEGLGDFCCAAKPVRAADAVSVDANNPVPM